MQLLLSLTLSGNCFIILGLQQPKLDVTLATRRLGTRLVFVTQARRGENGDRERYLGSLARPKRVVRLLTEKGLRAVWTSRFVRSRDVVSYIDHDIVLYKYPVSTKTGSRAW